MWKTLICVFLCGTHLPLDQIKATCCVNATGAWELPQVFQFCLTQTILLPVMHMMRSTVGAPHWQVSLSLWTRGWGRNLALQGGQDHRWGLASTAVFDFSAAVPGWQACGRIGIFKNGSMFTLTHNDWFHWVPRIITKGFPLLNGNYKRQIDFKQLTSWVKQLSPSAAVGGDAAKSQRVCWCC